VSFYGWIKGHTLKNCTFFNVLGFCYAATLLFLPASGRRLSKIIHPRPRSSASPQNHPLCGHRRFSLRSNFDLLSLRETEMDLATLGPFQSTSSSSPESSGRRFLRPLKAGGSEAVSF